MPATILKHPTADRTTPDPAGTAPSLARPIDHSTGHRRRARALVAVTAGIVWSATVVGVTGDPHAAATTALLTITALAVLAAVVGALEGVAGRRIVEVNLVAVGLALHTQVVGPFASAFGPGVTGHLLAGTALAAGVGFLALIQLAWRNPPA